MPAIGACLARPGQRPQPAGSRPESLACAFIRRPWSRTQAGQAAKALGWQHALSGNRQATMYNWEKQFNLISYGVAFVHSVASNNGTGPFDVLVRMRMVRALPHTTRFCACVLAGQTTLTLPAMRAGHAPRGPSTAGTTRHPAWRRHGNGLLGHSTA